MVKKVAVLFITVCMLVGCVYYAPCQQGGGCCKGKSGWAAQYKARCGGSGKACGSATKYKGAKACGSAAKCGKAGKCWGSSTKCGRAAKGCDKAAKSWGSDTKGDKAGGSGTKGDRAGGKPCGAKKDAGDKKADAE